MCFYFGVAHNKCYIRKMLILKHFKQIFWHLWLRNLYSDWKHPNIIETKFAIIASKNIELAFHDVCGMTTPWSRLKFASNHFLPVIILNVENMHIIHPMNSVVPSKINYFRVNEATCCWHSRARLISRHLWFYPSQSLCVEVKYIIKLS